jgi:hypothetical protein
MGKPMMLLASGLKGRSAENTNTEIFLTFGIYRKSRPTLSDD